MPETPELETVRLHPALRNYFRLVVWPVLAIPAIIILVEVLTDEGWSALVYLIIALVLLLFPTYAWFKTRFYTYRIKHNAVLSIHGLLSKDSHEIRIADIRAINIRQSLLQRIMRIGNVGFASAAGDDDEVIFIGVSHPERVKAAVQDRARALEEIEDVEREKRKQKVRASSLDDDEDDDE